jgi:hypothetical protein
MSHERSLADPDLRPRVQLLRSVDPCLWVWVITQPGVEYLLNRARTPQRALARDGDAVALTLKRLSGHVRVVAPAAVLALGLGRRVADRDVTK